MLQNSSLGERDLRHIWHPCTQMKDHETWPLFEVAAANGCYLESTSGVKLLDAISSWWCKSLGHQHPRIRQALMRQIEKFEHVILAGTTNDIIVTLSEMLAGLMPPLNKVLYAGDGSSAVEMALKLSLHAQKISGNEQRTRFLTLQNAYHGETAGAMSVTELGMYREAYQPMLFPVDVVEAPYVSGVSDPLWHDCSQHWQAVLPALEDAANKLAAVIVEPVLQGAGGMKVYSKDFLRRLRVWTEQHGIYLIADEIMTGIGRTGKMLACEHADIVPDFLCLSKGLTAGWLPLSVTMTRQSIFDLFYADYATGKSFLHSHTHSGNVLAASVAIEALNVVKGDGLVQRVASLQAQMHQAMHEIADDSGLLTNIRGIGAMVAADMNVSGVIRAGMAVHRSAMQRGVLLRPLGNTIYWLPPFIINQNEISQLKNVTRDALRDVFG